MMMMMNHIHHNQNHQNHQNNNNNNHNQVDQVIEHNTVVNNQHSNEKAEKKYFSSQQNQNQEDQLESNTINAEKAKEIDSQEPIEKEENNNYCLTNSPKNDEGLASRCDVISSCIAFLNYFNHFTYHSN